MELIKEVTAPHACREDIGYFLLARSKAGKPDLVRGSQLRCDCGAQWELKEVYGQGDVWSRVRR